MPFPDCSVVTHSNVMMTPSKLTFDITEDEDSDSVCDDPFFLKEVYTSQCGNFMNFLSLRFYVKSILEILGMQNLPF